MKRFAIILLLALCATATAQQAPKRRAISQFKATPMEKVAFDVLQETYRSYMRECAQRRGLNADDLIYQDGIFVVTTTT